MVEYLQREYIVREVNYPFSAKQEVIGELVRCEDCRWHNDQNGATGWMPCREMKTPNDYYCASGERKGGDGNG